MGQSTSLDYSMQSDGGGPSSGSGRGGGGVFSNEFDFLHEQIRKHSLTLRQLTNLTYDDLQSKIQQLNDLSSRFVDCNGKQLVFELKDGTESSVLWKGLIRIRCMKINPANKAVEKCRDLNLKQFIQVYNTMTQMQGTMMAGVETEIGRSNANANSSPFFKRTGNQIQNEQKDESWEDLEESGEASAASGSNLSKESSTSSSTPMPALRNMPMFNMSTSLILDELDGVMSPTKSPSEECCICMESKPEVILPCCHSYCLACIEQWNVDHKTCPICRETLETTDDTWVLEDKPNSQEVNMEIGKSLFELTK